MSRKKMSIDDFGETPRVMFCPYCGDSDIRGNSDFKTGNEYHIMRNEDKVWRSYCRDDELICLHCGCIFKEVKLRGTNGDLWESRYD